MATLLAQMLGGLVPTFILAWLSRKAWRRIRHAPAPLGAPHAISFVGCLLLWGVGLTAIPDVFQAALVYGVPQLFWFAMDMRTRLKRKPDALVGPAGTEK